MSRGRNLNLKLIEYCVNIGEKYRMLRSANALVKSVQSFLAKATSNLPSSICIDVFEFLKSLSGTEFFLIKTICFTFS